MANTANGLGTVLVLGGGGQIGAAAALRIAALSPRRLIIHSRRRDNAEGAQRRLQLNGVVAEIESGDVFLPAFPATEVSRTFEFYYDEFSRETAEQSYLFQVLERYRPDVVVDAINSATVVGYEQDPYTAARELRARNADGTAGAHRIEAFLAGQFAPRLIRFTQILDHAFERGFINRYVKVSTTGLGGMGLNIRYTHGDIADSGLSVAILGKVAAAGVLLQLLWSLSHTPGRNVQLIVPAALVGWEEPAISPLRHGDTPVHTIDHAEIGELVVGRAVSTTVSITDKQLHGAIVDSGENATYSRSEMTAITALNQMEAVTKEEVAAAVARAVGGSCTDDVLNGMDHFTLGPSFAGATQRTEILRRLRSLEQSHGTTLATGNLGPGVAKNTAEVELLVEAAGGVKNAANASPDELAARAANLLLGNDNYLGQLLGIGLGVLLPNSRYVLGPRTSEPIEGVAVTPTVLSRWARTWWVDLRPDNVRRWIDFFGAALEKTAAMAARGAPRFDANWQDLGRDPSDAGELLALRYLLEGGGRSGGAENPVLATEAQR